MQHLTTARPTIERKDTAGAEIKALAEPGRFSGYASVFGVKDQAGDIVMPGAFKATLGEFDAKGRLPALLWQHRTDEPIGAWRAMREDSRGLLGEGELFVADIPRAAQAYALMKGGALSGLSIGFSVPEGGAEFDRKANVRRLKRLQLWETSLVTFPANDGARVNSVKTAMAAGRVPTPRELEELLHAHGLSNRQAKAVVARGYSALGPQAEAAALAERLRELAARFKRVG
jgi:uncharacterized protein